MRYEIKSQCVTFFFEDSKHMKDRVATQSFAGTLLTEHQVVLLVESLVKKTQGQAPRSQKGITTGFLRPLFTFFQKEGILWPTTSADWQITVYRFFQFCLVDTSWSQARMDYRMSLWKGRVGPLLNFLVEEEIIPSGIRIPKIEQKKIRSISNVQPMLGQRHASVVDVGEQPSKLLVDIGFGMKDEEYLNSVEKKCRHLVGVIQDTCRGHWDALMRDFETGRQLAKEVTDSQIEEVIKTGKYKVSLRNQSGGLPRLASPLSSKGHVWALAFVRYSLASGTDSRCVSVNALRASPFFPKRLFFTRRDGESYSALEGLTALKKEQLRKLTGASRFFRFAGFFSNLDIAAVRCLLTIEHPQFNAESLQDAKLLDVSGKPYLLLTDNNENSIFSVDKPRAGRRKYAVLTPVAQKLVMDILRCTAPAREVLRRAGDKAWRYLFIGCRQKSGVVGGIGAVEGRTTYLTGAKNSIALTTLYPSLLQNGLNKGFFDYRRLRNTLGVLRWFETGSILEMSRRLGNTYKVTLEHYLPPALLHAWNTRIIRRFQNTLIVLAAHDEPYLLEVTDFSSMADLQHFIAQIIVEYPAGTSMLAEEVQWRLNFMQSQELRVKPLASSLLSIRLSPKSLGLLYSYSDLALRTMTPDVLDKTDTLSGLSPRHFTDMATMLRHAAESDSIHISLRESLDVPLFALIEI